MNYRYDLLQSQKERLGLSYGILAERAGIPRQVICDTVRGKNSRGVANPKATTLRVTFEALELDPKLALDFKFKLRAKKIAKKNSNRRAVNLAAR